MMRIMLFVFLQLAIGYGEASSNGGGAYAYVDSAGNRYGGTYGLRDGQVVSTYGDPFPTHFADPIYPEDDFVPNYFANLQNLLQESFGSNIQSQRLALNAAQKAFDLTSNQAYVPNLAFRFPAFPGPDFGRAGAPFPGFPNFPQMNQGFKSMNAAFASSAAGPGYRHQVASIYPPNQFQSNVNSINRYSDSASPANNGYYSVSSQSYSSSSNVNGKEVNNRGAETVVNENGKITRYQVKS